MAENDEVENKKEEKKDEKIENKTEDKKEVKQNKPEEKKTQENKPKETKPVEKKAVENKPEEKKNTEIKQKENKEEPKIEFEKSYFDGGLLQLIGWKILGFLVTLITLGICYPFALCFIYKWQMKHTVINGKRLYFDGKGYQLLGRWIL